MRIQTDEGSQLAAACCLLESTFCNLSTLAASDNNNKKINYNNTKIKGFIKKILFINHFTLVKSTD